ncbi:tryptophan synthase subunit alpha [Dysgonomonas sp. 511]|uniref:tryptophan synthase subunit alpha n=1 Tax=Dysgonomonas sp. 511 TaxID=2302930 RepID=UPI0013D76235|nr:tryptophan synthase subunit alpha [Dysgonomonas sp. 511]NDV77471.1 tryptophan synthase subunit alpha [Dysgonomonas sp. 511]
MNRIKQLFEKKQKDILSIYFTAGFPQLNDTCNIIRELEANGIDLIEVGIPFSDPMADGPTIQDSGTIALRNGMTLSLLFDQLKDIRKDVKMPLIMMGYLNPIMQYGFENFCKKCNETGIDGAIIPDLPFDDYMNEYKAIADKYDIKVIMLITPETSDERIRQIDEHTDGFIYMVSSAATTGAQKSFDEKKQDYFRKINNMNLRNPRLIGFGISNKATLEAAQANAGGAIIGSKFITLLKENKDVKEAVKALKEALSK